MGAYSHSPRHCWSRNSFGKTALPELCVQVHLGRKQRLGMGEHPKLLCTVLHLGSVHLLYKGLSLRK